MNEFLPDFDINLALPADQHKTVLDTLSSVFPIHDREKAVRELTHIAQTRLRWGALPVDLFFANTTFHEANGQREPAYHLHADDGFVCHLGDGNGSQRGGTKAQSD